MAVTTINREITAYASDMINLCEPETISIIIDDEKQGALIEFKGDTYNADDFIKLGKTIERNID